VVGRENEQCSLRAQARCENETVAVGRFTMTLRPGAEFESPEDARKTYEMLRGA
jgi:hypothetical protein